MGGGRVTLLQESQIFRAFSSVLANITIAIHSVSSNLAVSEPGNKNYLAIAIHEKRSDLAISCCDP